MKRLWVVVPLLAASLVFAALAWSSPVKPSVYKSDCPAECVTLNLMNTYSCTNYILPAYFQAMHLDTVPYTANWFYRSYVQLAEGFAALALSVPLLARLDLSWLRRPFGLQLSKRVASILGLVGASAFLLLVLPYRPQKLWFGGFPNFATTEFYYGAMAFAVWCLTILVLASRRGFVSAVRIFGFPAILLFMAKLLVINAGEMTNHVTNFLPFSFDGIEIVSNWFVLVISAGLMGWATLIGVASRLSTGRESG
ncbi:MAG: hypothetical protein ABSB29_07175 [Nitrososphaerales archaeon]|jgi:hypothetical protein